MAGPGWLAGPDRVRAVLLVVVTAGTAMGEAAVLASAGFAGALGLAPQISAPVPYGVFHDLRWVFVYHSSWGTFAAEIGGLIAVRAALNAVIIALAWPAGQPRPPLTRLLARNAVFTAVAVAVLSVWVCVSVAASGTSLSWFLLGELLPVIGLALILARGGIVPRWWRGLPPLRAMGWTLVTFVALAADALIVQLAGGWWAVPVAGLAGAGNAGLWWLLVRVSVPDSRPQALLVRLPRIAPLTVPLAVAITAGGVTAMSVFAGFGSGAHGLGVPPPLRSQASDGRQAVMLFVDGYDSSYNGSDPVSVSPGLVYEHYSYRGLNRRGLPRPYPAAATHQSIARSARLLARQVQALHVRTGRPVAVVAESEGTLVARDYLAGFPHRHVDALVLLSPLIRPARIYVALPGADSWGTASGWELRGMLDLQRIAGGPPENIDEPFVRSILGHAPFYRNQMMCPVRGVRTIAFLPFASAAVAPPGPLSDVPVAEIPGLHGQIGDGPPVQGEILRFVRGGRVPPRHLVSYQLARDAAVAWDAPPLALSLVPAWHYPAGAPDASFGGPICAGPDHGRKHR